MLRSVNSSQLVEILVGARRGANLTEIHRWCHQAERECVIQSLTESTHILDWWNVSTNGTVEFFAKDRTTNS